MANKVNAGEVSTSDVVLSENDGTNACVFLALKIGDLIIQHVKCDDDNSVSWEEMATTAEEVVTKFPSEINSLRDCSEKYDPASAKAILSANDKLIGSYDLCEECVSNSGVLTELGWQELFNALNNLKLGELKCAVGLYTCSPYCFLIGVICESFFIIDTHPISEALGGNGNGALVYTEDRSRRSCRMLIQWIIKRLTASGIREKAAQSVSWLIEVSLDKGVYICRHRIFDINVLFLSIL